MALGRSGTLTGQTTANEMRTLVLEAADPDLFDLCRHAIV